MTSFTCDELISIGLAISQHLDTLRIHADVYSYAIAKYEHLEDKIIDMIHELERG